MRNFRTYKDYKYNLYFEYEDGSTELAAWYDDEAEADKEARFLRSKGHKIIIHQNF